MHTQTSPVIPSHESLASLGHAFIIYCQACGDYYPCSLQSVVVNVEASRSCLSELELWCYPFLE